MKYKILILIHKTPVKYKINTLIDKKKVKYKITTFIDKTTPVKYKITINHKRQNNTSEIENYNIDRQHKHQRNIKLQP